MSLTTDIILTAGEIVTKPYILEYSPADSYSTSGDYYFQKRCNNEQISPKVSAVLNQDSSNIVKSDNEWYYESVPVRYYMWHSMVYNCGPSTLAGVSVTVNNGHIKIYGTVTGEEPSTTTPRINGWKFWGFNLPAGWTNTEFKKDHVYCVLFGNTQFGSDHHMRDHYDGIAPGAYIYAIRKLSQPNGNVLFNTEPVDKQIVVVKREIDSEPGQPDAYPCIYLVAWAGDTIDVEFDISIIDLTELAGVDEEISTAEAQQLIINTTGGIKLDYKYEYTQTAKQVGVSIPQATLKMYFPQYSVDTLYPGCRYMLTTSTYIKGRYINLGCFLFKRTDALACTIHRFGSMEQYVECIEFKLPDLYSILFNDECSVIKTSLGYPLDYKKLYSSINFSLYVVDSIDDHYIKSDRCNSGQNSVMVNTSDELKMNLSINYENSSFNIGWSHDKFIGKDIRDYIKNLYDQENMWVYLRWVVMDTDNIYSTNAYLYDQLLDEYDVPITDLRSTFFNDWTNWKPGLVIRAGISLVDKSWTEDDIKDDNFVSFLTIFSNRILVDQDVFAKLLYDSQDDFTVKINFDDIDMTYKDIKAINTIKNVVRKIQVNTPENAKNNLIHPVFYQTRDLNGVMNINPSVTENIALQLDSYKSQVKTFILQIEGTTFNEIGRTSGGVIFKVVGKRLPKEQNSGSYYVLNQDYELVTSGLYEYTY